ncbi:MAG: hypothetical protein EU532_02115 [Promethearchaeota archaeon]|nr:MAG: hypothetical protein EU532_02115 [Candidatus Lokiarchaeota archaeon]
MYFNNRDIKVKLGIWDLGGADRFKMFLPFYAKGYTGGIFMYYITRKNSFDNLEAWISHF